MPQQCCLLLLCIHSIQESTLKELINFRGQFGGKYWVKTCEYFTSLFTMISCMLRTLFIICCRL